MAASTLEKTQLGNKVGSKTRGVGQAVPPPTQPSKCPECGSLRVWKDGLRHLKGRSIQRFLCRDCGFRFSESTQPQVKIDISRKVPKLLDSSSNLAEAPMRRRDVALKKGLNDVSLSVAEDSAVHVVTNAGKALNTLCSKFSNAKYCVSEREMKNLSQQHPQQKRAERGATTQADVKGRIVNFSWWLKKQGYAESTIFVSSEQLRILAKRGANILDSESVKETIAQQSWAESRKSMVVGIYTLFLKMLGQTWEAPIYKPVRKIPFIPTEKEIDDLIAGCGKKLSTYLQLLKETAMRSGEADQLRWTDIDFERRVVRVTPEKHSDPRILQLSAKCVAMINALPKTTKRVFGNLVRNSMRTGLGHARKRLARKLNNPRLMQIHFHTLRHWKATTLYHQTKDILYVKAFLGHKKIESTLLYVQLEQALFDKDADNFTCRVAKTQEQITELIEAGFDYVTQRDGLLYFRKRK